MRLALVISSLSSGGAEHVMTIMANYWAAKGWKITLLTLDDGSVRPFYDLDERVTWLPLGLAGGSPNPVFGIWNNLRRTRVLRQEIRAVRAEAVISFVDRMNVITLLATRGLRLPVIVSERVDPAHYSIGVGWERLRAWLYPLASVVVTQSARASNYFGSRIAAKCRVIPNPVLAPIENEQDDGRGLPAVEKKKIVVAMGRFTTQKRFDLLLEAFARVHTSHPEWRLLLLGEGPLRPELERYRDRLRLQRRVEMPGLVRFPHAYLKRADLFVLTSRYEGFPNALLEAMACGLPVISTDCPSGPREIIRNGVDGVLVPPEDMSTLALAMDRLMSDEAERKRLASRAVEVTERFGLERVMRMWEEVLDQIILRGEGIDS